MNDEGIRSYRRRIAAIPNVAFCPQGIFAGSQVYEIDDRPGKEGSLHDLSPLPSSR